MKKLFTFFIAMVLFNSIFSQTNNFQKEPYLFFRNKINQSTGEVTPELEKIVIQWQLTIYPNDPCRLQYGLEQYSGIFVDANYNWTNDLWYVELDLDNDLDPNEFYYYQAFVMDDDIPIDGREGSFITPPSENATNLTFYAYSDPQNPSPDLPSERHNIACEKINDLIDANHSSQTLLLNAGDWNFTSTEDSWNINYFNNGQAQAQVKELLAKIPVMGVYGNHDMWDVENLGPMVFEKYWPYSYVIPTNPAQAYNRYYSFDYGPIHVSCLHLPYDNWNVTSEALLWLDSDLSDTDKKWKILMFHTPGYSNGGHPLNQSVQNDVQPLCVLHGVQVVISGHQNVYAHWLVQGVHHLTIDGVGRTYIMNNNSNNDDIGELKTHVFNHFAEINIHNDLMNIIIHYFDGVSWHSDFDTYTQPSAYKICNNEHITWDQDITYADEIRICSGSILTIKSKVGFVENGKIIVERGGKLELDGGKLTSVNEDEMWQGIEVWGTATAYQNPVDQGWVKIMNEDTIENAICGIRAVKMDNSVPPPGYLPNYGYTGGIIHATDAHFINNQTAVQFYDYSHSSASYFNNCEFKLDGNYFGTVEPENYMVVDNMTGVRITFCEFLNEKTPATDYTGILSENSTILLEGECVFGSPCTEWDYGTFENLEYGVYATAATTSRYADIRHTNFINNYRGVYIGGMTSPRITSNWFSLNTPAIDEGYGLYLDRSTGYWVEDNLFEKTPGVGGTHPRGIGIVVNESGRNPNQIYLNTFNYVENAINVQGKNRHGKIETQGLVLKCNDYNHVTNFDETIIWDSPIGSSEAGIARKQGLGTLNIGDMAGNLFYVPSEIPDGDFDDINNTSNRVDYYYSTNAGYNNVEPMDAQFNVTVWKYGMPTPVQWTYETACLSNINTGGGGGTGIEEDKANMDDAREGIETTQAVLTAMIDGGDTEALNTEVETSTPPEALQVYSELMSESPNLSETVVESSIEKENVLPNAMVRDVMVANPHTAKSLVLLEKLDERFDPMPEYMKAQILAGQNIQTLKEELEAELAGYQLTKAIAMENIIRYYQDELEPQAASDSIVALYQADNTLSSSYRLAWLYFERGEYQNGESVLNNLPAQYSLDEEEQLEYNDISAIYRMLAGLYESGNTIASLTGNQISELQTLEAEGTLTAQAYARNILMALDKIEYEEPVLFPDFTKSSQAIKEYEKLINTKPPQMLEVYPNPSSGYVIIGYSLETEVDCSIEIKDVTGKEIQTLSTNGKQDQLTVVTENWKPGVYIATLFIDGKSKESCKFTLVK